MPTYSGNLKQCSTCREFLDTSLFNKKTKSSDGLALCCRECNRAHGKRWRDNNKEHKKQKDKEWNATNRDKVRERSRRRRIENPEYHREATRDLGCSIEHFKAHIESQFQEGMSWENWGRGIGRWNIDHIMPLSAFDLTNRQHILLACHFLNMRPMWQEDNVRKAGKVPE